MADNYEQKNSWREPVEIGKIEANIVYIKQTYNEQGKYELIAEDAKTVESFEISSLDLNEGVKIPVGSNSINNKQAKNTNEVEHGK